MTASAPEARPLHAGEKTGTLTEKAGTLMEKSAGLSEKSVPPPQPAASTGRTHRPALFGEQRALHVQNNP